MVWFETSKVVHLGDCFFNGNFPFIDLNSGGSAEGLLATVHHVLSGIDETWKVVPGHGELASIKELRAYHDMLADSVAQIRAALEAGDDLAAIQKKGLLKEYAADWGQGFIKLERIQQTLVESLR